MSMPLAQFVQQLEDCGVLSLETLKEFLSTDAAPQAAEELARELVRQKKLTRFQAEELWRGNGKSLVLGNYILLEKIGQGGMGAVYKAEHRRMKRIVAIKMLSAKMTKHPEAAARFQREVEAAARLEHVNIVTAHDADEANGVHFLVMQFVEGRDLSAYVRKHGPVPVAQAVQFILQAARGLEFAHGEGVVHRDIKPANLLLDRNGNVKVLDMGLARILGDSVGHEELTRDGAMMGTVDYMPPEQAQDTKAADGRADIYSLGCTLHFLLTGNPPYSGDTIAKRLLAHRNQPIPALQSIHGEVPGQVESIFRQMVAKQIEDRYQNMSAVIADIEQWISSSGPEGAYQRPAVSAAEIEIPNFLKDTSVSGAAITAATGPAPARSSPNHAREKPGKRLLFGSVGLVAVLALGMFLFKLSSRNGAGTEARAARDSTIEITGGRQDHPVRPVAPEDKPVRPSPDRNSEHEPATPPPLKASTGKPGRNAAMAELRRWQGWPADAPPPAIAPFDAVQAKQHQTAWAAYLKLPVEYTNSLGMKFMLIPPGEFTMGSTPAEIEEALPTAGESALAQAYIRSEAPQHTVILTQPFYLGAYEVTQKEYVELMRKNPSHFSLDGPGKDAVAGIDPQNHPVEKVSWNDAAEFCAKLSQREGLKPFYFRSGETVLSLKGTGYRLPTEAEWEFACRAGTITKFWTGDTDESVLQAAWLGTNSGGRTHARGELKDNPLGLFDIHGNVWEWVQDGWNPTFYTPFGGKPAVNPQAPSSGDSARVIRGGNWFLTASNCRSALRDADKPSNGFNVFGFRVALVVGGSRVDR